MEKNLRILIVEDEFVTLDLLRDYLEESGYEVSGDAMSAAEAIAILEKGETDFAMLDIHLKGDKDGIWLAEQLQKKYQIPFVFLSAFSDSTTVKAASRTNPLAYLVKPFSKADIFTTIEVALHNYNTQQTGRQLPAAQPKMETQVHLNEAIFVKDNLVFKKVFIKEIRYVQAYKNYLELHFANSRQIIRSTLTDFQMFLPQDDFMQTHRSYLVNIHFLEKIGGDSAFIGKTEIPISRNFKESVLKRLKIYH
jgi:DNA-binding LytR/AlgR family response regulator